MCDLCADVAALAADVALDELTAELIDAEAAAGWSIHGASRPLLPHEIRAGVRFADLDRLISTAAGRITRHATTVRDHLVDALATDLATIAAEQGPLAIADRVRAIADPTTGATLPGLAAAIDDAADRIETELRRLAADAGDELAAEAARQGLARAAVNVDTAAVRDLTRSEARRVATQPATRLLEVASTAAARAAHPDADPFDVLESTLDATENASIAGTADTARQAANRAHGAGRNAAAATMPEPREVYASELLDTNTCRPCAAVDGRTYETLDAALVDYPSMGGYRDCAGGPRCRGTLVLVWPTEAEPTLDTPGDRPADPFGPDRTPRGPSTTPPASPAAVPDVDTPPAPAPAPAPAPTPEPAPEPAPAVPDVDPDPVPLQPAAELDPATMTDADLETAVHDAVSRGDFDAAERYGDELDRRTNTAPVAAADERDLVPGDPATYREPVDDPWNTPGAGFPEPAADDWNRPLGVDDDAPTDAELDELRRVYEEHMNATGGILAGESGIVSSSGTAARRGRTIDRVRDEWDAHIQRTSLELERYLRGGSHISKKRQREALDNGVTLESLLTGPIDRALYYASEDVWRWWTENPRLTFAEYALGAGVDNAGMRQRAERARIARDEAMARYEESDEARARRRRERQRRTNRGRVERGGDVLRNPRRSA